MSLKLYINYISFILRSAIIYTVSKSDFDRHSIKTHTLAGCHRFTPQLVNISDSRFLALRNSGNSLISYELNYVFLNASGGSNLFTGVPNRIYYHNTVL